MTAIHAVGPNDADDPLDAALAAALDAPLPDVTTEDCVPASGLVLGAFLRPHLSGLHPYLIERGLPSAVDVDEVLPDPYTIIRLHKRRGATEVLAAHDGCLVVIRTWRRAAEIWVSGADRERVERIASDVYGKAPKPPQKTAIRVTFWQYGRYSSSRSRDLDVPTWDEVAHLYPASVRRAMSQLATYRPEPGSTGGRLVLWHGPPGTGKTTAVRALFDAWRTWASAHVVSDPERLLNEGDYLANVLLDPEDDSPKWRVVVIEDAEELLRRDARAKAGAALGRLLNTGDGLLGQGSKAIILLTTNEQVDEMHPALLRPGRCLARIEFPALEPTQAGELLGHPVNAPMTLAEILERKGKLTRLDAVAPPTRPGNYL